MLNLQKNFDNVYSMNSRFDVLNSTFFCQENI